MPDQAADVHAATWNSGYRDAARQICGAGRASDLTLDHFQLELGDRFRGVQTLWARLGAVHDGVAAVEPERIFEIVEPFSGGFIAGVLDPAGCLQQRGG